MGERDYVAEGTSAAAGGGAFTPCSSGALERIVRVLRLYYPHRTTDECREALAAMYGHESWHVLETAAICGEPSECDEDETLACVQTRYEHHCRIAQAHLGGVTEGDALAATRTEQELETAGTHSISRRHDPEFKRKRVDRARYAYNVAYARQAMLEIRPTAKDRLAISADDETLELTLRVDLLSRALVVWVEQQRPRLAGVSDRISELRVRQHSQCDLLRFAFLWGEACVLHPTDIPESLQIYPVALCARWYAWNASVDMATLARGHTDGEERAAGRVVPLDPMRHHQLAFLRTQPREDLVMMSEAVRERQITAGCSLVRPHLQDAASAQPIGKFFSRPAWSGSRPGLARQAVN